MLNRPLFWLGLLLGAFTTFRLRLLKPRLSPPVFTDFQDLITDPVVICDNAGTVIEANPPAQALFGSDSLPSLRYSTGQRVPPGQHPLRRASAAREASCGRYHHIAADGSERVLEISARPLLDGKAAAVFRDVTGQQESEAREQAAQARQAIVQTLCRHLSQAQTAAAMGQAVAEETLHLLADVPEAQVRLYLFDPVTDMLTCLAAVPDDRPKRLKPAAEAQFPTIRFDAQLPELWQMYVARKPSLNGMPLVAGGITIGHLSVASAGSGGFEPGVGETLERIASLAALALAGLAAAAQEAAYAAQATALREIVAALGREQHALADVVAAAVKRVTHAEVCTLSVPVKGKLCVIGEAYKDDLVVLQAGLNTPRLHSKATQKAWKTQKSITHLGLPNPGVEAGPWRAFAGSAGCHSVIALPLAASGVLSVYTSGASPLPEPQIKFLETVAAFLFLSPLTATDSEDAVS